MQDSNKILLLLGEIKAKQETQERNQIDMDIKLDLCVQRTAKVESMVELITPEVADYTKMKHRGIGIFATVGVLGTVFFTFLLDAFKTFIKS